MYTVFTRISETMCTVIKAKAHPKEFLFTAPQYPIRPPSDDQGSSDPPDTAQKSKQPAKIPDIVRFFDKKKPKEKGGKAQDAKSGPSNSHTLVDIVEIKPLWTRDNLAWGTQAARDEAASRIPSHLFQVYSTAMAAFVRNPKWKHVYVMLVIGIYFTQLHWKRPSDKVLKRTPVNFKAYDAIPHERLEGDKLDNKISNVKAAIEEAENRVMPKIVCWNEPIVSFSDGGDITSDDADVELTRPFLWAMRQPFKHHRGTKFDRCWLSAPRDRPEEINLEAKVRVASPFLSLTNVERICSYHRRTLM